MAKSTPSSSTPSAKRSKARLTARMKGRKRHIQREDFIRNELEARQDIHKSTRASDAAASSGPAAALERLKARYLRDRNPIHIFNALVQIKVWRMSSRDPTYYPPWVEAFLFAAADTVMGIAVAWPEAPLDTKRKTPVRRAVAPIVRRNADGSVERYGLSSGGLSAEDRIDIVTIEALGFGTLPGGTNPVLQEHRDEQDERLLKKIDELRAQGLTYKAAITKLADPSLPVHGDFLRKIRRMRKRLEARNGGGGET